jgi:hypothetical protein
MVLHDIPDECVGNPVIFVAQHISDSHYLRPGDLRLRDLQVCRDATGSFGNDFNRTLDRVPISQSAR